MRGQADAYAWAVADAKPTHMRGLRPTQPDAYAWALADASWLFLKKKIKSISASHFIFAWAFSQFGRREYRPQVAHAKKMEAR